MAPVNFDSPVVQTYIVYSAILAMKVLAMSVLTGAARFRKGIFANPEDTKTKPGSKVKFDDPDVERVRRGHLNDLENITVFWVLGALYVTTGPAVAMASLLFRVFTIGRMLHTFVYCIMPLPQPARAIAFGIPYMIMWYMGVQIVLYYITAI